MKLTEMFLAELKREADSTRRVLSRVPEGRIDWSPHVKSMKLGYLASLVASMPGWIAMMINGYELDLNPPGQPPRRTPILKTKHELLQSLQDSVAIAREALERTNDEHLMTSWRLLAGGKLLDEKPRYAMIRDGVFQHLAHHRGQLTVYLRLNDATVPAIYGPSADEGPLVSIPSKNPPILRFTAGPGPAAS
jgi:uncharacterized damage-inducible protein DinB